MVHESAAQPPSALTFHRPQKARISEVSVFCPRCLAWATTSFITSGTGLTQDYSKTEDQTEARVPSPLAPGGPTKNQTREAYK